MFVEAERNKAAGKYSNASIDEQTEAYRREGMTPYSDEKLPIISGNPQPPAPACLLDGRHAGGPAGGSSARPTRCFCLCPCQVSPW